MSLRTIQEIEHAIGALTPTELEELYEWIDQRSHPVHTQMQADLAAGRLDSLIEQALSDAAGGRVQPV